MAGSVTANRAETARNRLRTILENTTQLMGIVTIKTAGGFYRRVGFTAKSIAFNACADIDRFEVHRARSILTDTARQRFRAKIRAEMASALSATAA